MNVLQRFIWNGTPVDLGDCFRLTKTKNGRQLKAVCRLFSHLFGWELRLEVNGELQRSEVCRSEDQVFSTFEQWKAGMVEKGWQ